MTQLGFSLILCLTKDLQIFPSMIANTQYLHNQNTSLLLVQWIKCAPNQMSWIILFAVEYNRLCTATTPVDPCQIVQGLCENGHCLGGSGGYLCQCNPGYILSPDGTRCEGKGMVPKLECHPSNDRLIYKCLLPWGAWLKLSPKMISKLYCALRPRCKGTGTF